MLVLTRGLRGHVSNGESDPAHVGLAVPLFCLARRLTVKIMRTASHLFPLPMATIDICDYGFLFCRRFEYVRLLVLPEVYELRRRTLEEDV